MHDDLRQFCLKSVDMNLILDEVAVASSCKREIVFLETDSRTQREEECAAGRIVSTIAPVSADWYEVRQWDIWPSTIQPWHVHDCDKSVYVLEGSITIRTNDGSFTKERGDLFKIPRGVPHTSSCLEGAKFLVTVVYGHPQHGSFCEDREERENNGNRD